MEAEIKAGFPNAEVELISGSGGIFDVSCDGKTIFSKLNNKEQRFPKDGEIVQVIKNNLPAG